MTWYCYQFLCNSTNSTAHVRIALTLSNRRLKFYLVSSFFARPEVMYNVAIEICIAGIRGVVPVRANFLLQKWVWSRCGCLFKARLTDVKDVRLVFENVIRTTPIQFSIPISL